MQYGVNGKIAVGFPSISLSWGHIKHLIWDSFISS
jgi:hypothetical protein